MSSQTYSYHGRSPTTTAMAAHGHNSGNHGDAERRSHGIRESKTTTLSSSDREGGMAAAGVAASSSSNPSYHYHYHGPTPHGNVEQMASRSANGWVGGEDGSSSSKPPKSKKRHHSHRPHHHHKHTASGSLSFSDSESSMSEDRDSLSSSLDASPDHPHHHRHHHHSRQQPPAPPFLPPLPGHSTHLQNQEQQASIQRQIEQIQQQQRRLEKKQKEKARKQAKRRRQRRSSNVLSSEDSITITHRVVRSAGNEEEGGEDAPRGKKGSDTPMGGGLSPASSISSTFVSGGGAAAAAAGGSDAIKKRKKKDRKKGKEKTYGKDEDEDDDDAVWKKKKKGGELGKEPQSGSAQHYSRHRPGSKGRRRSSSIIGVSTSETLSPSSSGSPLSNLVTTTTTLTMRVTPSPHLREEGEDSYDDDDDNNEDEKKKKKKKQNNRKEQRKMRQKAKTRPGSGGRRRSSGSQREDGSGPRSHHHHHHHRRHSHPSRSRSCSSSSCIVPSSSTTTPGNSQSISVHTDASAASLSASTPQSPTLQARGAGPSTPSSHAHHHHHHHPHHHNHRSSSSLSLSRHPSHGDPQRSSLTVDIPQSLEESANSSLRGDKANEKKKMEGGNEKSKRHRKGKKNKGQTTDRAKREERDSASRRGRRRGEEGGNSGRHHSRRRHRRSSAGSLVEEETTVTISKTELKPISTVLTSMDRLKNDPQLYSQAIGGGGTESRDPLTIVITKDQQDRRHQEHSKPSPTKSPSQTSSPRSYAIPTTTAAASSSSPPPAAAPGTPSHPGVQGQYVHDVDMEAANAQKMHNMKLKAACLAHEDFIFDLHVPSWAETQQQKLDAAHEKAAKLLAALERGDKWQVTEPFELSRLMRLCNLELSFQELSKPNDKPQYLEIMALRKALGELRQHPKKTSGVSLVGTIDHALNKLERAEEELRRSQWNAVPLGRAALPVVKGLEDCLNTPLVDRSLEANEDRIAAQLDAIKASTKLRDAALADGEMGIAEEQYYVKGQLLEHLLELIKDKFRILGENESRNNMMPNMEDTRRRAANEIANIRNRNRRLQDCCEDDLKNLIHAIHTADIADAEAAKEYVSKRDVSEQELENNLKRQSDMWKKMHELERGLQLLGEERMEEVKRRIDGHDREEKRHVEYQQFLDVCEQHKKVLELTIYNCGIGNRCAAFIEEMISETCKSVQSRMEKMNEEIADLRLQVHIEYLEAFRRLYKTFGQLMYKKEKRLEEIDRQIRTTHIQLEFAIETFDPNAKKHSDAKKELHQLRAHVEGELELLKEKISQALDNFGPTEDALNHAGIKFKHPVDEVEDINLSRRSKMVEYRAHLAKQEEERIKAEREEIKRAKKIHGDNQRSRGVLQIT